MARCTECGYYSLRDMDSLDLCESDEEFRKHGKLPTHYQPKRRFRDTPVCSKQVHEFPNAKADSHRMAEKERSCNSFFKWQPGYSPKEHNEMSLLQKIEAKHDELRRSDDQWKKSVQRSNFVLSALGIFAAIATAILAPFVIEWFRQ